MNTGGHKLTFNKNKKINSGTKEIKKKKFNTKFMYTIYSHLFTLVCF